MNRSRNRIFSLSLLSFFVGTLLFSSMLGAQTATPQYPALPSESPAMVNQSTDSFDYTRRVEMIPMRDGVKLHTVILVPKGAKNAPILLTRTPYNADVLTTHDARGGNADGVSSIHLASEPVGL